MTEVTLLLVERLKAKSSKKVRFLMTLSLSIDDVAYVENLGFNLLSISQLCRKKYNILFSENERKILKDGITIAKGVLKNNVCVMKIDKTSRNKLCLTTLDYSSTLWHRRLGHANMRLIQSLSSKELVRNLPKLKYDQHFCDACKIGKQVHSSHKAKNMVSTTRCLELV